MADKKGLEKMALAEANREAFNRDPMADIKSGSCDGYFSARMAGISHEDAVKETITKTQEPGSKPYHKSR